MVGAALLVDLDAVLQQISSVPGGAGPLVYASVDTDGLKEAVAAWATGTTPVDCMGIPLAQGLCVARLHAFADLLFIFGYAIGLHRLAVHVGLEPRKASVLSSLVLLADALETGYTAFVFLPKAGELSKGPEASIPECWYWLQVILTDVKWGVIALAVVVVLLRYVLPRFSGQGAGLARTVTLSGSPAAGARALWTPIGLFVLLVAVPAGGPLEQMPDVLRGQYIDHPPWSLGADDPRLWVALAAGAALLSLVLAALFGARLATCVHPSRRPAPRRWTPVVIAGVASLAVLVVQWLNGEPSWVAAAAIVGVGAFAMLGLIAEHLVGPVSQPETDGSGSPDANPDPDPVVGALVATVVLAGGVGLVRALARPSMLAVVDTASHDPWGRDTLVVLLVVMAGTIGGTVIAERIGRAWRPTPTTAHRLAWSLLAVVLVPIAGLAGAPEAVAPWLGTTGTLAVIVAALTLVVAIVTDRSRSRQPWHPANHLGFGHTPWLVIGVVVWLLAGTFQTTGGYHDIRGLNSTPTDPAAPNASASVTAPETRQGDVDVAIRAWAVRAASACTTSADDPVPMLFVAAPGGGIRAAYWTSTVLDTLASTPCGEASIFAISAVSGGSVGTAAWLVKDDVSERRGRDVLARDIVAEWSEDRALAAATASLLTRDLAMPLLGLRDGWDDRAAIHERIWEHQAFTSESCESGDECAPSFDQVTQADGAPWIVFNASSVTEPCRVVVSSLDVADGEDALRCLADVQDRTGSAPILVSTVEVTDTIEDCRGGDESGYAAKDDLSVVTASFISARFPFVSPSASFPICRGEEEGRGYAVDGGYLEPSGLVTLLELWDAVEESIAAARPPQPVEPWIVVADNAYRLPEPQQPPLPDRPRELWAPAQASGAGDLLDTRTLFQRARNEMTPTGSAEQTARFVRLAPPNQVGITAPLGWVLSPSSRQAMCHGVQDALAKAELPESLGDLSSPPCPS